ncbi:heavy metal-associated isoprenylated plant protein 41-like isoform X1 [Sesamum indicum]|uniref:Heavy metal-associated isoprenylated plant protein 41-like isoform X1 n=1 Tax=Sesamum indicum TaxID=4182 RepID=A0A6I9UMC6_SESIN|nr:heavy metal-associated isoprenylated plant protein 41-like isoform X1 [Sesamum indicum]
MKQRIVINVPMQSEKGKSKAMKIAVGMQGVNSVIVVKDKDRLEVIGEGVDSVCLAKSLRKKFCFADIVSIGEVKPPPPSNCAPPPPPPCQPYCYASRVYGTALPNCSYM